MYIVGQEETVGESSVSSGCWGEDSDHKYGWTRPTPTFVASIRFLSDLLVPANSKSFSNYPGPDSFTRCACPQTTLVSAEPALRS